MLTDYLGALCGEEADSVQVRRTFYAPGIVTYDCRALSAAPAPLTPLAAGRLELLFCREGRLELERWEGGALSVGAGEVLLLSSAARLTGLTAALRPFRCTAALIREEEARPVLRQFCALLPGLPDNLAWMEELLDRHRGIMVLRDESWNRSAHAALDRLAPDQDGTYFLFKLLELIYLLRCGVQRPGGVPEGRYYDRYQEETVRRVHDYICAHPERRLTIQELARQFQLSPTLLKECFRQLYGDPVHTYLQRYRLQTAAHLLATTGDSITEISAAVGYTGVSRFSAAFKKQHRMTPSQYRRLHHGKNV